MKIQQIQNNNTSFKGLNVDKHFYKDMGCKKDDLLRNKDIKNCVEKFDVLIRRSTKKPRNTGAVEVPSRGLYMFLGGLAGTAILGASTFIFGGLCKLLPDEWLAATGFGAFVGNIAGAATAYAHSKYKELTTGYNYILQAGKNLVESKFGTPKFAGAKTGQYEINKYSDIRNIYGLTEHIEKTDRDDFLDIIDEYEKNGNFLYTAKDILAILKNPKIKKNYYNGECFNYKCDEKGNSLLTRFFDIIPNESNKKEYNEIFNILKNMKNIDYNQTDSEDISILEKIINSENIEALDLVKDTKLTYSRELDYAYNNVESSKFKRKVRNLDIDFPNIKDAIRLQSKEALSLVISEFQSPLCNVSEMMDYVWGHAPLVTYNTLEELLHANGVKIDDKKGNNYYEN